MKLFNGLCAACAEDVGPCEGFPCADFIRGHAFGSFDLAPFFVRVNELEWAGRILAERIAKEKKLSEQIRKAIKMFGVEVDAS